MIQRDWPEGVPMSMKHRRSNKETKKPKQNKTKPVVSSSSFPALHSNPARAVAAAKRR